MSLSQRSLELVRTAVRLATASSCAYVSRGGPEGGIQPDADPRYAELKMGPPVLLFGPQTDTHGYLAEADDGILLAFRGSLSIPNWLVNLSFDRVPCSFGSRVAGTVHAGFARAWHEVRPQVLPWVLARPRGPLRITGHSLGGALALLAAMDLAALGLPVETVHTFGAPRVGDAAFASFQPLPVERWVNAQDPVPLVPWSQTLLGGYQQLGRLHYLTADGELATEATVWQRLKEQVASLKALRGPNWSVRLSTFLKQRLADHDLEEYLRKLTGLSNRLQP